MIKEYDKIRLKTGEIARISEVLEEGVAYIADIFKISGSISIEQITHTDIESVFIKTEHPVAKAV